MRAHGAAAAVAAIFVGLGGCDFFTDPPNNRVELEVDSSDGSQVLVITADEFTVGVDQDGQQYFNLFSSDTAWVATPYQANYTVTPSGAGIGGFYSQAAESENPDATVSMRVVIDGEQKYFDEKVLTGEGLRFYYRRY